MAQFADAVACLAALGPALTMLDYSELYIFAVLERKSGATRLGGFSDDET